MEIDRMQALVLNFAAVGFRLRSNQPTPDSCFYKSEMHPF
ncbi:hypothetical protein CKA32_006668 [Geitlerinema sp. FC II]|nr:hypothetical protein CKA32_006668 [Geitlerinema sp. FC II]